MASKTFSIRLSDAEVELLQAFQASEDKSLTQTVARLVRESIGANSSVQPANSVNIEELVRQEVERAVSAIASDEQFQELVHITVNRCTQNQNDILADHEFRLGKLETPSEVRLRVPVTTETTIQDVVLPLPQEQEEDAIAAETTEKEVVSGVAGKKLSKEELKSKANSIARTFKNKGLTINLAVIKGKILELYPNSDDWISDDARLDVMRALEKQQGWKEKTTDFLNEVKW